MKQLERDWYHSSLTWRTFCLLPFSWLFRTIVRMRRFLYRARIKKTFQFKIPVIVVGNITVGGTGKTPFVIWLAAQLRARGLTPGIVSRGVGGNTQLKPHWVKENADVREVGDEAVLLLQKTQCPLVIGIDRVACVKELLAKTNCDVVISDDGLQHYRLGRQIEVVLVDGARGLGNQQLLPAGPLREAVSRLKQVDFIVCNGNADSSQTLEIPREDTGAKVPWTMQLQGNQLVSLKNTAIKMPLNKMRVHAVAAIGNPDRFFNSLREKNLDIIPHVFPDHYFFKKEDFAFGDTLPIVMTEKDAVKCHAFADERFWILPVDAIVDDQLIQKIFSLLTHRGKTHEVSH